MKPAEIQSGTGSRRRLFAASGLPGGIKSRWHLFAAFALPMLVMYIAYVSFGVWPFGDRSVLVLDLNGQYVYYYEALKAALFGDKSLLYSWSRNLSGEMMGIVGYYLASPFSIIPVLFPRSLVTEGLLLMTLVKLGAAGLTFGIFLQHARGASRQAVVLFGTLYGLMGYAVVEVMNIMWIDGLIFLPLIVLGVERLVRHGRMGLYIISLAVMFVSNFYIGYMVGIFTFLYFLYFCTQAGTLRSMKLFGKRFLAFAVGAAVAVACAAFMLLPMYYSLKLGKLDFTQPDFSLKANFKAFDFITKLLPESYDTVRNEGLPFVYCGTLTLLLVPLYFLNRQIGLRRKLGAAAILGAILGSMYLSTVDIAWHGFQLPNWLPYRYSFLFSFLLLLFAYEAFTRLDQVSMSTAFKVYAMLAVLLVVIDKVGYTFIDTTGAIWFTFGAATVYLVLIYGLKKLPGDGAVAFVLVVITCTELFVNITETFADIDKDVVYSSRSSYLDYIAEVQPVVDEVYDSDDGFYRMEKTFDRTVNDPMALGMYGISHSSSTLNAKAIQLLKELGYMSRGHYVRYNGGTPVNDSLMGIKYLLSKDVGTLGDYEERFTNGEISVYENPYALPIVLPVSPSVKNADVSGLDPFDNQNRLLSAMAGEDGAEYFKPLEIDDTEFDNVDEINAGDHKRYVPETAGDPARIEYTLYAVGDHDVYMYLPAVYERQIRIDVNGSFLANYFETDDYCIVKVGSFKDGEEINVRLTLQKDDLYLQGQYFYYFDKPAFEAAMARLDQSTATVDKLDDTHLTAQVNAQEDGVLYTSIPYEPGWTVKVDGQRAEQFEVAGALLAVDIPAGEHTVTLTFFPKGLLPGLILSVIGIALTVLLLLWERKRRRLLAYARPTESDMPL